MLNRISVFWQRYLAGAFKTLDQLKCAVAVEREADDAPDTSSDRFFGKQIDGVSFDAPARLAFPSAISSNNALRQHDRADWQHVDPRIALHAARLIEALRRRNIPMYCHAAFRTQDEQHSAFARGVSKAVWPRAPHCQGKAVDVVHGVFHWEMTEQEWNLIGKIGKDLHENLMYRTPQKQRWNIVWGGDFKSLWDPAHWEIEDWRNDIQSLVASEPIRMTPRHMLTKYGGHG